MWNIIKRRNDTTMFRRVEGDYSVWIIEYPGEYEVVVNNIAVEDVDIVFNKGGYTSFYEASEAAKFIIHELCYGA